MLERNEALGGLNRGFTVLEPRLQGENLPGSKGHSPTRANFSYISFKKLGELIT